MDPSDGGTLVAAEIESKISDDTPRLSARLVAGEEAAWTEFHARTFNRLLRYLLTVTRGNEDVAREVLQLTYIKAVRHVRRFETEGIMWGWLAQIAHGCFIDSIRRNSRYAALLTQIAAETSSRCESVGSDSLLTELLSDSVANLDPADRALLDARYAAQQSIVEIANVNGTTPKAVESRLARIRTRLRAWLIRAIAKNEN